MRFGVKGIICIGVLMALAACDTNWDEEYEDGAYYEEPAYSPKQQTSSASAAPQQVSYEYDVRYPVKQEEKAEALPLPLQGPCASWERGCYADFKTPAPSFDVAYGPCHLRYGGTGRCQVKPKEKEPENPVRTHCFRNGGWETCY